MKKLLALVLSLVMVLACGAIASADGEVVNVMYGGGTPETLDPALNSASTGSNTIRLAFCGLMGTQVVDGVASKAPEMAESYEISDDGLVYTFKLREGLKWSDGSDFFASDFVKSWNRAADPALGADYGFLFDYIARNEDGTLNAVADDEARTLVVTLVNPCAYFLELCGFTTYYPVKVELADNEGAWATDPAKYIGTGPFRMTSFAVDDVAKFEKNEYYWNAENVKLGGVNAYLAEDSVAILAAYESDAVSFIESMDPAEFDRLEATYPGELVKADQLGTYYVLFNVHKDLSPEGKTLTVQEQSRARYALGLMVNRQDEVDYVTMGGEEAATGFFPSSLMDGLNENVREAEGYGAWYTGTATPSAENPAYTADMVEAIKILMDLGYSYTGTIEGGDVKFTDVPGFEFSFNQNATNSAIVQYIQETWNSVGITATINTEAWATLQIKLGDGDAEASRMGWVADFNDCVNFLEIFISNSGNNYPRLGQDVGDYTRYTENTKDAGLGAYWGPDGNQTWAECYDALVNEIKAETDPAARAAKCAEAEKILMSTGAVAPMHFYKNPYMAKPNIKNLAVLPTGDVIWNYVTIE
ncbi:peptide ABC transporter substrate-binding protein [Beduinella massiliensis]|uniref:peptide ABC transporter substrate-binding protein n=1 Tax=Beduinella massiliensis TaxID=1852363 RepID=UPI0031F97305